MWESNFDSAGLENYLRARYHGTVVDRYLLMDSPERVGQLHWTFSCGYHTDAPAYELRRGIRRLILLKIRDDEAGVLADVAARAPMARSVVGKNSHQRRNWLQRPVHWTHVWEQGFRTRAEVTAFVEGDSEAATLEQTNFHASGLDVESFDVLTYPVRTRPRFDAEAPSDHVGERLLQTFSVELHPDTVDEYLALLRDSYDPAAEEAGMRLVARSRTSAQLGENVTVQSTWSMADDDAFSDVRGTLLDDERWWHYSEHAERLALGGTRWLGYAS